MKFGAVILAAGSGTRFGADKTQFLLRGRPIWRWAFDAFKNHSEISAVGIVTSSKNFDSIRNEAEGAAFVIEGGASRPESSKLGFEAMAGRVDAVLVHDGARPLVSSTVISNVIRGVQEHGSAAAAISAVDTVRTIDENGLVFRPERHTIRLMQTPQGATVDLLREAYGSQGTADCTDEMAMLEAIGAHPVIVEGDPANLKVTEPIDLRRLEGFLPSPECRTGFGYDIHAFSSDSGRQLWLGGVLFAGEQGLEGHSDADAALHAIADALLGAAGLGDIGTHFSNKDERWRNAPSTHFLSAIAQMLGDRGWKIGNIDCTILAEHPRVSSRYAEMREAIACALGIDSEKTSIKATTCEGIGSIGRGEGIAAQAVATIERVK